MKGKEKCEFLKGIRKRMAEDNGIPYEPRECTYEGECTGTCPFCEKEAAELMEELRKKEAEGADIKFDLLSIETIEAMNETPDIIRDLKQEPFITPGLFADAYEERERQLEEHEMRRIIEEENSSLMGDVPSIEEMACLKAKEEARRRQQEVELKLKIERHPDFDKYLSELSWTKIEDDEMLAFKSGFYLFNCLADNHAFYDLHFLKKGDQLCKFFLSHPYKWDVKPLEYYFFEESDKDYIIWGLKKGPRRQVSES